MKNREKYSDFLIDCFADGEHFGVDVNTNKPCRCKDLHCGACKFHSTLEPCVINAKEWINEDVDDWADFRDLKRGDIIMLSVSGMWYPVIFVRLDEFGLRYSKCINNHGDFVCAVEFEEDPRRVKKCLRREYYEQ